MGVDLFDCGDFEDFLLWFPKPAKEAGFFGVCQSKDEKIAKKFKIVQQLDQFRAVGRIFRI